MRKGQILHFLLSDAWTGLPLWPTVNKKTPDSRKALYFSHGFGIHLLRENRNYSSSDVDVHFGGHQKDQVHR